MNVLVMQADGRTTCRLIEDLKQLQDEVVMAIALYFDGDLPPNIEAKMDGFVCGDDWAGLNDLLEDEDEELAFFWNEVSAIVGQTMYPRAEVETNLLTHVILEIGDDDATYTMLPIAVGNEEAMRSTTLLQYRDALDSMDSEAENADAIFDALKQNNLDRVMELWPIEFERWEVKVLDAA